MNQLVHLRGRPLAPERDFPRLCVLKFGSSVLGREEDYPKAALEIYRHVCAGEKVIAVVSALAGRTDELFEQAQRVGGNGACDRLVARLARIGELQSAALMALALCKVGVRASTLDPHEMGLVAEGAPLDSNLVELDAAAAMEKLRSSDVLVVPGFVADHSDFGVVTLGRGGTDLTAVFLAASLGAHRVRLIKDVDGVYEDDPAQNSLAERFSQMDYVTARQASRGLIQVKAIEEAEADELLIEVASLGSAGATEIGDFPVRKCPSSRPRKLRVTLLGCGTVGGGVLSYLQLHSELFDVGPILVRRSELHDERVSFTDDPGEALGFDPDIMVDVLGGSDFPASLMRDALLEGVNVVTANKAALAEHWDSLHSCAAKGGADLFYSGAVGGGSPILEAIRRLDGSVVAIEGVMNGTCNYLLSRLAEGWSLGEALGRAQQLGFAEADPIFDLDGHDVAAKLSILAHDAFAVALSPQAIPKHSLKDLLPEAPREATERGEILKQVGRCALRGDGRVEAEVLIEALPASHPLALTKDEENCFLVTLSDGTVHQIFGKGAGRWPTASAVFADLMDARTAILNRELAPRPRKKLKIRA